MIRPNNFTKSSVTYKFILYKMKMLVTDHRGKLRYLESLDNILYDIFGIKNTMKKINNAYDPREISGLIDNLGVNVLLQLFNSGKMYKIMEDLVQINYRMNELQKEIRKQSRKDKRDKDDVKEYNYLMDLYKKSIKYIRNKFGIKNSKTSYKRKYQSLNNIVKHKGYDDWDDDESFVSILMRDDDYYFDDYDDDDDDFDPSTSELEDFVNMMNGNRKKSRRRNKISSYYDDDDDNLSIFDDDDDDESYERRPRVKVPSYDSYEKLPPSIDDGLYQQLSTLTDTVADLSSAVQHLMMKDEYNAVQRKRDVALRRDLNRQLVNIDEVERYEQDYQYHKQPYCNQPPINKEVEVLTDLVGKLQDEQARYRNDQKTIAEALDYLINEQDGLKQFLSDIMESDEDDNYEENVESGFIRPIIRDQYYSDIDSVDSYYENSSESMSREELIDMINGSASKPSTKSTSIEATKTTVKVESINDETNDKTSTLNTTHIEDDELQ